MILDQIWAMYPPMMKALQARIRAAENLNVDAARNREPRPGMVVSDDGIAMIPIVGPMVKGAPDWVMDVFGLAGTTKIRQAVEAATAEKAIKSMVLRIDTPGGSVDGLADLGDTVFRARTIKPVIAQVEGMAASAGYYIASQARVIVANRMDLVGSIGTRMTVWDTSKMFENAGIKAIPIDSAPEDRPFKSAGEDGTEITEQQQADFQRIVDAYFADFRNAIIRGRGISNEQLDAVADGRVWPAEEAKTMGLVDAIGSFDSTVSYLRASMVNDGQQRLARAKSDLMSKIFLTNA